MTAQIAVIYQDPRAQTPDNPEGQLAAFYTVQNDEPIPFANIRADLQTLRDNLAKKDTP